MSGGDQHVDTVGPEDKEDCGSELEDSARSFAAEPGVSGNAGVVWRLWLSHLQVRVDGAPGSSSHSSFKPPDTLQLNTSVILLFTKQMFIARVTKTAAGTYWKCA